MKNHTFVICAYGKSRFLEECIESILKQTARENVVITTSTDNDHIEGIAKKYQIEIKTHEGGGIGVDWNFGYECADTKYVTLVHQDDVYKEDYLERLLTEMNKYEDSLISFSNYREIRHGQTDKLFLKIRILKLKS